MQYCVQSSQLSIVLLILPQPNPNQNLAASCEVVGDLNSSYSRYDNSQFKKEIMQYIRYSTFKKRMWPESDKQ
jgi:hypothetical protein